MYKLAASLAFAAAVAAEDAAGDDHFILTTAPAGAMEVGHPGKVCLWIAFAGLFIPCLYMGMSSMSQADGKRYFHTVSFLINAIASIAYLAMANGYGCVFVYGKDEVYRQFFYARYIDWSLTTPLQLLDLAGLAGASNDTTLWLLATDFLMIVSGLIGGLIGGNDKSCWGFWIFGMMAYIPIVYLLAVSLPGSNCSAAASSIYKKTATLTVVFWTAYPVVWILAEGTSVISSDVECILYTILDIIAKSVFGLLIVSARDGLDAALEK